MSSTETLPRRTKSSLVDGSIRFECCGVHQAETGKDIGFVTCSRCHSAYRLWLAMIPSQEKKFPTGVTVEVTDDFIGSLGSQKITLPKGSSYRVASDRGGFFATSNGFTPVEYKTTNPTDKMSQTLVVLVDDNFLKDPNE